MERFAALLLSLSLCLPWAALIGLHVADLARIMVVLSLLCLLLQRGRGKSFTSDQDRLWSGLSLYALFFPLAAVVFLAARVILGSVSLDTSMFVQVIDSLARQGVAWTSLLSTDWQNFFGHHLDLQLWLPAAAVRMGMPPLNATLAFHLIAIALTLYYLGRIVGRHPLRYFLVALFALLPVFRHSLFWSVHDDIFALPFMAASWFYWRKGKMRTLALNLVLLCLCKETMGLWVGGFALMAFFWEKRPSYLLIAVFGFTVFCTYVFAQPLILGKSFDHISKISSAEEFFSSPILLEKASYTLGLLIPFILLMARARFRFRDSYLLLPTLPFLGMILVSNFDEMWKPNNYYGVVPSLSLLLASLDIIKRQEFHLSSAKIALILSLAFTSGTLKLGKTVWEAMAVGKMEIPDISFLPDDAKVAISPSAHLYILQSGKAPLPKSIFLGREFHFTAKGILPDAAIFLNSEKDQFSPDFLSNFRPCEGLSSQRLIYLCR